MLAEGVHGGQLTGGAGQRTQNRLLNFLLRHAPLLKTYLSVLFVMTIHRLGYSECKIEAATMTQEDRHCDECHGAHRDGDTCYQPFQRFRDGARNID